jgi:hypothetical protein
LQEWAPVRLRFRSLLCQNWGAVYYKIWL